jgi:hypothetical protein
MRRTIPWHLFASVVVSLLLATGCGNDDEGTCGNRECGMDPTSGESCGTCSTGDCNAAGQCEAGVDCPTDMDCGSRVCGPDPVCGESCGTCSTGDCNAAGQCEAEVDCPADMDCGSRVCGPDPVCGESCGTCSTGSCDASGQCVGGGCALGACTGDQACNPTTEACVDFAGSCDATQSNSFCMAFIGPVWTEESAAIGCASYTYLSGDCSTQDAVGVCYQPNPSYGSGYETLSYYYSVGNVPFDATKAKSACDALGGTFYPL